MKKLKQIISAGLVSLVMAITPDCEFNPYQMQDWYYLSDSEIPSELKDRLKKKGGEYFFEWIEGGKLYNCELGNYIVNWRADNITYECYVNGFQPAEITLKEKKGNCANRTLLDLALAYNLTDGKEKGELVECWNKNSDGEGLHYCSRINGEINEKGITQIYRVVPFDKIGEYIYWRQ